MKKMVVLFLLMVSSVFYGQQSATYFPAANGYRWLYQSTPLDSLQNTVDSLRTFEIDSLAGDAMYQGVQAKFVLTKAGTLATVQQTPYLDTTYYNFSGTETKQYFRVPNLDSIAAMLTRTGLDTLLGGFSILNTFKSFEKWYTMYKFSSTVNTSYTIFQYDTTIGIQSGSLPLRFLLKGKRLADKQLTTQAGTHTCKVFLFEFSMNYLVSIPPFPAVAVPLLTIPDSTYLAPSLWMVRRAVPSTTMNLSTLGYGSYTFPGMLTEVLTALPVGSINITAPAAGAQLTAGDSFPITWTSSNIANVRIDFSSDNGANWQLITALTNAAAGVYNWTVPQQAVTAGIIRVQDVLNPSVQSVSGTFAVVTTTLCKDVAFSTGWNLLSAPVKSVNMQRTVLFPSANSPLYGYTNGYIQSDSLTTGNGYWLRFPAPGSTNMCGTAVATLTVPVKAGWNLIGPYHTDAAVSSVTTVPAGIVSSPYYGYFNGYQTAATLQPGKGYWVRCSSAGQLQLTGSAQKLGEMQPLTPAGAITVTVSDAAGNSVALYLVQNTTNLSYYALPPVPPAGVFDARFSTGASAVELKGSVTLELNSAVYPVRIVANTAGLAIRESLTGREMQFQQENTTTAVIENHAVQQLTLSTEALPLRFGLEQNYPNPFNPGTTIRYSVQEKGLVQVRIYNQLGEQVACLANGIMEPGSYQLYWNASEQASGVYIVQLKSGSRQEMKKIMLVK